MKTIKNGEKFGNLTVKRYSHNDIYICVCACGREKTFHEYELLDGTATNCGHGWCNSDMLGKRYGRWTVIDVNKDFKIGRNVAVKARCDCGTEKLVNKQSLKRGLSKSCGCLQKEIAIEHLELANAAIAKKREQDVASYIGKKYGELTIDDYIYVPHKDGSGGRYHFKCTCSCGTKTTVERTNLLSGHTRSCGCISSWANKEMDDILTKLNILFKREYRFDDCRDKKPLPFDFAIFNEVNELIGLIELNGSQHYATIPRDFYSKEHLASIKHHDYLKEKFCIDNDIPLLIIPYQYFGKEKMKEFLLSSDFWTLIQARSTTKSLDVNKD